MTAARFTTKPFVVRVAVPAFVVPTVAVQAADTAALAVALPATVRISPPLRSVMLSVPEARVKVSLPVPPVRLSLPTPPTSVSLPPPPVRVSAFDEPVSVVAVSAVLVTV